MDAERLRASWQKVARHGDDVPLFFYSDLFLRHPEVRQLFPVAMGQVRDRLVGALGAVVSQASDLGKIIPVLEDLGRDHRKFGAIADHFPAVGHSLLVTLAYFCGPDWSPELETDWKEAYTAVSQVMIAAAAADAQERPAVWDATVTSFEMRRFDISVFRVTTSGPLAFEAGQSVSVECPQRPRLWRLYSMANAPREDGTLDFHVRMIDGGPVSMVLARGLYPGSRLRLGPPVGSLTYRETGRPVLMIAGSTGLAPLKAITEHIATLPEPPAVQLFYGAKTADGLYDLPELDKLAASWPWLTVVPVAETGAGFSEEGTVTDAVARRGPWAGHDVYIAGPSPMADAAVKQLTGSGVSADQIHTEDFGWSEP